MFCSEICTKAAPDIERAYHILAAAASDAVDLLQGGNVWDVRRLLQSALLCAEEDAVKDNGPDRAGPFLDECISLFAPGAAALGAGEEPENSKERRDL